MIGQTIQSKPRLPIGALLFLTLGVLFAILAIVQHNLHWALGSVLPFLISGFLWWVRPRPFVAHFTEGTMEVMVPSLSIPYPALQGLRAKGRLNHPGKKGPRSFPMQVFHEEGMVEIPARLDVPSGDVYDFLLDQFPPRGFHEVNPLLGKYLHQQEETFGPDRVWTYRARNHLGKAFSSSKRIAICLAVVVTGVIWLPAAFLGKDYIPWSGWGIIFLVLGGLLLWSFRMNSQYYGGPPKIKNWRNAGLVISPVGLALVQGTTQGQMRWDELRDVAMRAKPKGLRIRREDAFTGILLKFEGAMVRIADIYDRPLPIIYQRIIDYWQP